MFTGIIIATGRILSIEAKGADLEKGGDLELAIDAAALDAARMNLGDSVSVQGCCLTVTRRVGTAFHADVSRETLSKTTLGKLASRVEGEPRAQSSRRRCAGGPFGERPCRRRGPFDLRYPRRAIVAAGVRTAGGIDALRRDQGFDLHRRCEPHRQSGGRA